MDAFSAGVSDLAQIIRLPIFRSHPLRVMSTRVSSGLAWAAMARRTY